MVHTIDELASSVPSRIAKLAGVRTQLAVPMPLDERLIPAMTSTGRRSGHSPTSKQQLAKKDEDRAAAWFIAGKFRARRGIETPSTEQTSNQPPLPAPNAAPPPTTWQIIVESHGASSKVERRYHRPARGTKSTNMVKGRTVDVPLSG